MVFFAGEGDHAAHHVGESLAEGEAEGDLTPYYYAGYVRTKKGDNLGMVAALQETVTIEQTEDRLTMNHTTTFRGEDSFRTVSYDLDGEIFGSPALWQGRVFVASWGRTLHCLAFSSGDDLWHQKLPSAVTATPVVAGGILYVACEGGELLAFDARGGKPLWQDRASHGPIQASPLPLGNRVIVAALDGTVTAYEG